MERGRLAPVVLFYSLKVTTGARRPAPFNVNRYIREISLNYIHFFVPLPRKAPHAVGLHPGAAADSVKIATAVPGRGNGEILKTTIL